MQKYHIPVAIIQEGSTENEKIVFGNVDTIVATAGVERIKSPAVIIIGENVRLHPLYPTAFENSIKKLSQS